MPFDFSLNNKAFSSIFSFIFESQKNRSHNLAVKYVLRSVSKCYDFPLFL